RPQRHRTSGQFPVSEQQIYRVDESPERRVSMSLMQIFDIAGTGMSAQSLRLNTTASNMANANSASSSADQTYRARHPVFAPMFNDAMADVFAGPESVSTGVRVLGVVDDARPLQPRYEPGHPLANEEGYVYYPK